MNLADLRRDYTHAGLDESDVRADPIDQFRDWFDQATAAGLDEPNAMTLATSDADGRPSARIVLLKGVDDSGFTFFTNYEGRKGRELAENPRAALVFFWAPLERQVRVEGAVERVSREESDAYFRSRPANSRLGAWASSQSEIVLGGRHELEAAMARVAERFAGTEPPLPSHWGGYRVRHESVEFWQGRPSRMHDRIAYRRGADGRWEIVRLSP